MKKKFITLKCFQSVPMLATGFVAMQNLFIEKLLIRTGY